MEVFGWIQLALFVAVLFALTKPVGIYLTHVLDAEGRTLLSPLMRPVEQLLYRLLGIDPKKEQSWQQYAFALIAFSLVGCLFTYAILRLQHILPLNPQSFGPVSPMILTWVKVPVKVLQKGTKTEARVSRSICFTRYSAEQDSWY